MGCVYDELEKTYRRIESLAHFSTEKRVLHLLCELVCSRGENGCTLSKDQFKLGLTQAEIAEVVATSRVSVSKVFSSFRRRGLIEFRNQTLQIKKVKELFSLFDSPLS